MLLKIITTIGFSLLASQSYASQWQTISASTESVESPKGVFETLEKYKPLFDGYKSEVASAILAGTAPLKITSIIVQSKTLKWIGPTKCMAGDSRLNYLEAEALVETTSGIGKVGRAPVEEDPCL